MRIPTASYNLPSRSPARLVNVHAQASVGKTPVEIVGFPGISTVTPLTGGGRGLHPFGGTLLAVAGSTLYDALTGTVKGSIPGVGRLMFADNGIEMVTDTGYLYNGSSVSLISDVDKVPWSAVDYCEGYIVAVEEGTNRMVGSALLNAASWGGLDYFGTISDSDTLVTLATDHNQVVCVGQRTTEILYLSGVSGFPFERVAGGFLPLGALSRFGVAKADNTLWLAASDRTIRAMRGNTWVKVSQVGIEEAMSAMDTVTDCEAFSYTHNGNIFVTFRFPTENRTFVLNVTTSEWSERESYHRTVWEIVSVATFNGKVYAQHSDGSVGVMQDSAYTEFGETVRRELTFPPVYSANQRQTLSQFDAILRTGDAPVGLDPTLQLEVSHDGGNNFLALPPRSMGQFGEYARVIRWNRLGQGRDVVFRLSTSDAVPFHLVSAELS